MQLIRRVRPCRIPSSLQSEVLVLVEVEGLGSDSQSLALLWAGGRPEVPWVLAMWP